MHNFIGIDISLNSTAVYIESNKGSKIISVTNKKDNNIYIKELARYNVDFVHTERKKSTIYSDNEVIKLRHFDDIATLIKNKCIENICLDEKTFCQIEGYSFSKNTSSILDIVSLSTLIRSYLLKEISNLEMSIISPSTLKLGACKLVYPSVDIGIRKPKLVYKNNDGVPGGAFKKQEMFKAILDSDLEFPIRKMLKEYEHLIEREKIPNPLEDIIDAIFCCKIKISEQPRN